MKFLADENIPWSAIQLLRENQYDVFAIGEHSYGASDRKVLEIAVKEHRAIITFDRDYGEHVFLEKLPCPPAIIYLRFRPQSPEETGRLLLGFIVRSGNLLEGSFWVVEAGWVRRSPLTRSRS